MDSGKQREIADAELEFINHGWVFVNLRYPGSANAHEENLIDLLTRLREERNHAQKERHP